MDDCFPHSLQQAFFQSFSWRYVLAEAGVKNEEAGAKNVEAGAKNKGARGKNGEVGVKNAEEGVKKKEAGGNFEVIP